MITNKMKLEFLGKLMKTAFDTWIEAINENKTEEKASAEAAYFFLHEQFLIELKAATELLAENNSLYLAR